MSNGHSKYDLGFVEGYHAAEAQIARHLRAQAKLNRHELGFVALKWHRRLVAIADNLESGAWQDKAQPMESPELAQEENLPLDFSAQCPIVPNVEGINPTNS